VPTAVLQLQQRALVKLGQSTNCSRAARFESELRRQALAPPAENPPLVSLAGQYMHILT
jgi:hypothetical protein